MNDNILWIDCETNSLPIHTAKIITISFLFNDQQKTLYINPMKPIEYGASKVNGIYDNDVIDWKPFSFYAESIYKICSKADTYGTYNGRNFDIPILTIELLRCGYELPIKPQLDMYEIIQSLFKSLKLSDIYRTLLKDNFNAHESMADCIATRKLYNHIKENYLN